jgi:multiple sugar transport system substrate-binding protein
MKTRRFLLPAATAGILALTLSACGGGGGGTTGGGGGSDAEANLDGRGPITYVQGKDNSNVVRPLIEKWNAAHLMKRSRSRNRRTKPTSSTTTSCSTSRPRSPTTTWWSVDVIWTAEFAAKGWLQPLKDKMAIDTSAMLKPPVESGTYKGTLYAGPQIPTAASCTTARTSSPRRPRPGTR